METDWISLRFNCVDSKKKIQPKMKIVSIKEPSRSELSWGPPIGLGETARVISGPANTDAAIDQCTAAAVVTCNGGMRICDPTPSTTRRLPRLLRGGPKPARTSSVELDGGQKTDGTSCEHAQRVACAADGRGARNLR